jgi:hypothetical protein
MKNEAEIDPIEYPPEPENTGPTVEGQIADLESRIADGKPLVAPEEEVEEKPEEGDDDEENEDEGGEDEGEDEGEDGEVGDEEEEEAEDEDEGEEEDEEDEGEVFVASIPGRRAGDPDIELEIAGLTKSEVEGFNRLRNGYMRGEDARSQLSEAKDIRDSVEAVAYNMDMDPVGYINGALEREDKIQLVKFLLTDEETFQEVFPTIVDWEHDDSRREGEAAKIERDQMKKADKAARDHQAKTRAREEGDTIVRHLEGLAESLSENKLHRFMRFALQDLQDHVKANPKTPLTLEAVNKILVGTGAFETFGIKPNLPKSEKKANPPRSKKIATAKAKVQEARDTEKRLKTKRARKRSAATSAPPGSGAPPVSHPFKPGETVEERIAYIEKHGIPKT